MEMIIDASIDRQRVLWVATCARYSEFIAEGNTVDEMLEKFPAALERANLPPDAKLQVRYFYDHGLRAAQVAAISATGGKVETVGQAVG